jgi:hypothetical protein
MLIRNHLEEKAMKEKILPLLCSLPLIVTAFGCTPDSPLAVLIDPPKCIIASIQKSDASWPYPAKIVMTVRNSGDATAYNVECDVKLKSGNRIVDEGVVYFGTLGSQESYTQDESFWSISTHADYATAYYHLYWYDSQGGYHD